MFIHESRCRACGQPLVSLHHFGNLYLPEIVPEEHLPLKAPLEVTRCSVCQLVQLGHTIDPEVLFVTGGWYRRDLNQRTNAMLEALVKDIRQRVFLTSKDWVLDIGANDGYLLSQYPGNVNTFGVSPAKSLCTIAATRCTRFECDFFTGNYGIKFKVITALWVFSRKADLKDFIWRVDRSLTEDGILILQFTDLVSVIKNLAVDSFRHEEILLPTLNWICEFLEQHGLFVFDAEEIEHEAGNIRIFVDRGHQPKTQRLLDLRNAETEFFTRPEAELREFARRASAACQKLRSFTRTHTGYAIGAFSRGSTLLQCLNTYSEAFFKKVAEINPAKYGKVLAGTRIRVVSEAEALKDNPAYFLVLPWYLKQHFLDKYFAYMQQGGSLVFPLPKPEICTFVRRNGIGDIECREL